ncbi:MAG TPA: hypothetical protein VFR09_00490 [Alphaproteobacteria bacterium]|nr:hypothetical protein [Alphaproteobacteria bacterium]
MSEQDLSRTQPSDCNSNTAKASQANQEAQSEPHEEKKAPIGNPGLDPKPPVVTDDNKDDPIKGPNA